MALVRCRTASRTSGGAYFETTAIFRGPGSTEPAPKVGDSVRWKHTGRSGKVLGIKSGGGLTKIVVQLDDGQRMEGDADDFERIVQASQASFDGQWISQTAASNKTHTITGTILIWSDGQQCDIKRINNVGFSVDYDGNKLAAKLENDGTLHWSDEDVWRRTNEA